MGFPGGSDGKEPACQCRRLGFNPWVGKIPWSGKWQPTPVFLPGEFHGQRSLPGYSPWGRKESDTKEHACEEGRISAGEPGGWYSLTTRERASHTLSHGLSLFLVECDCLLHPEGEVAAYATCVCSRKLTG